MPGTDRGAGEPKSQALVTHSSQGDSCQHWMVARPEVGVAGRDRGTLPARDWIPSPSTETPQLCHLAASSLSRSRPPNHTPCSSYLSVCFQAFVQVAVLEMLSPLFKSDRCSPYEMLRLLLMSPPLGSLRRPHCRVRCCLSVPTAPPHGAGQDTP